MCVGVMTTHWCDGAGVTVRCTSGTYDSGFHAAYPPYQGGPFAIIKRDTDGSFAGMGNVINQTPITGWCDTTGINGTHAIAPDAALIDVNIEVWIGMNNTGALSIPVPDVWGTLQDKVFAGQGFGIMVSDNLYQAMQNVQADDGRLPANCDSDTNNDGAFDVTNLTPGQCQPSISKAEYAAIVDSDNFAYTNSPALTGTTNPVNLCRRVETSGTQVASNAYFLNNSCGNANPTSGFKQPKRVAFPFEGGNGVVVASGGVSGNYEEFPGAFSIFEGMRTGDIHNCISRRNLGQDPDGTADASLGKYAIGVVSLTNPLATGRQYVKLDGVSPNAYQVPVGSAADIASGGTADGWAQDGTNRITTVKGYYDFASEFEMLSVNDLRLYSPLRKIRDTFANPQVMRENGVFQANNAGSIFTHADNPTKVHKGTRYSNFCAPQTLHE